MTTYTIELVDNRHIVLRTHTNGKIPVMAAQNEHFRTSEEAQMYLQTFLERAKTNGFTIEREDFAAYRVTNDCN